MADRITNEAVETVDATVVSHGPRNRAAIELPEEADLPSGAVVRLVLDGHERFSRPTTVADGGIRIAGAYDAPDLARSAGDGDNRLRAWLDDVDLSIGRTVHVDVIEDGFKYGLRAPGERATYDAPETPDDSLSSIAEQVESEEW